MTEFRNADVKRPDGAYVKYSKLLSADYYNHAFNDDEETAAMLESGELVVLIVKAKASILVVKDGHGRTYEITSTGIYSVIVASPNDAYVDELYTEELDALKADLAQFGNLID